MIGFAVALLARAGVRDRLQKPVAWGLVILLAIGAVLLGLHLIGGAFDRAVDRRVEAQVDRARGDVMTNAVAAEQAGGAQRRASEAAFANIQNDYRKAIDDADGNDASALDALGERMRR